MFTRFTSNRKQIKSAGINYQCLPEQFHQSLSVLIFKQDMKAIYKILLFSLLLLIINSCITQFFPETNDDKNILVVEGLITDQPEINTIKLSTSMPLGDSKAKKPLSGCYVVMYQTIWEIATYFMKAVPEYTSQILQYFRVL